MNQNNGINKIHNSEMEGNTMKRIICLIGMMCILVLFVGTAFGGSVRVRGHFRSNGTYVQPHYRSTPNRSFNDNWSTRPSINPYTGRRGTRAPRYYTPPATSYSKHYRSYKKRRRNQQLRFLWIMTSSFIIKCGDKISSPQFMRRGIPNAKKPGRKH